MKVPKGNILFSLLCYYCRWQRPARAIIRHERATSRLDKKLRTRKKEEEQNTVTRNAMLLRHQRRGDTSQWIRQISSTGEETKN